MLLGDNSPQSCIGFLTCDNAKYEAPFRGAHTNRHDIAYSAFFDACKSNQHTPVQIDWRNPKGVEICRAIVIAAPWDYTSKPDLFLDILAQLSSKTTIINSLSVVKWNFNKRYLLELAQDGFRTVKTSYISKGNVIDPKFYSTEFQTEKIVVKPAIGSGGEGVRVLSYDEELLDCSCDTIVQPFVDSVMDFGEVSAMFVNSAITHAVRKKPNPRSILVHQKHMGLLEPYSLDKKQLHQVSQVVGHMKKKGALFGRVDFFVPDDQNIMISEIEVIDPELFPQFFPDYYKLLLSSF